MREFKKKTPAPENNCLNWKKMSVIELKCIHPGIWKNNIEPIGMKYRRRKRRSKYDWIKYNLSPLFQKTLLSFNFFIPTFIYPKTDIYFD